MKILETHTQTEGNEGLGSWRRCPGEYQEKAPEVDKRRSRAGSGRGQAKEARDPSGGGGASGPEQMEGICFAELNSSGGEV